MLHWFRNCRVENWRETKEMSIEDLHNEVEDKELHIWKYRETKIRKQNKENNTLYHNWFFSNMIYLAEDPYTLLLQETGGVLLSTWDKLNTGSKYLYKNNFTKSLVERPQRLSFSLFNNIYSKQCQQIKALQRKVDARARLALLKTPLKLLANFCLPSFWLPAAPILCCVKRLWL